jgi:type I restriction enzyme, S subunit
MSDVASLDKYVQIRTNQINPFGYPNEVFEHFSIPNFDQVGGSQPELGATIESGKFLLDGPAVLVSKLNPRKMRVLSFARSANRRAVASTEFIVYEARNAQEIDLGYLCHLLTAEEFARRLQSVATGTTNSHVRVRPTETLKWPVRVPPLEEQRRIAEILDTIDETIQATERIIAKLEKEKIGVLSAELATLQSNTSWLTVDETFDVSNGITLNPSRAPKANATKYLRVANVRRGSLDISDVSSMEATTSEQSNKCLLPGDLLVIEGHADPNEIGRCALATKEVAGFVFQNHLFRLRPKTMISEFGEIWLNSDNSRRYWRKMCSTSSGLHTINRTMLRSVPVPETTPQDQKRVVSVAAAAKLRLGAETDRLEKLRSTRSGLAADLLSGRVRTVAS